MLQQTQVKTVIPYWERWMRELPNVTALAEAKPERVLKLWEGLGYYSRARNLQNAARQIVALHGGRFPSSFEAILDLPGIGRYTAGAIASIAFGDAAPILDGNVIRVLARYFGIRGDPKAKITNHTLWALAEELVRAAKPLDACSELNQGLMELGALVCLPREPQCKVCPLHARCFARKNALTSVLPETPARPEATKRLFHALLARDAGKILARQRPDGFWELPNWEVGGEKAHPAYSEFKDAKLCEVKHTITRFRMTLEVFSAGKLRHLKGSKWVSFTTLEKVPIVTAHRRALVKLALLPPPMT